MNQGPEVHKQEAMQILTIWLCNGISSDGALYNRLRDLTKEIYYSVEWGWILLFYFKTFIYAVVQQHGTQYSRYTPDDDQLTANINAKILKKLVKTIFTPKAGGVGVHWCDFVGVCGVRSIAINVTADGYQWSLVF